MQKYLLVKYTAKNTFGNATPTIIKAKVKFWLIVKNSEKKNSLIVMGFVYKIEFYEF